MTKEEFVYNATLNYFGSGLPDPELDHDVIDAVARERLLAERSVTYDVACPVTECAKAFGHGGPLDGEHFADLWEHLITAHRYEPHAAGPVAEVAWAQPAVRAA